MMDMTEKLFGKGGRDFQWHFKSKYSGAKMKIEFKAPLPRVPILEANSKIHTGFLDVAGMNEVESVA